jgi:hypothetical protein
MQHILRILFFVGLISCFLGFKPCFAQNKVPMLELADSLFRQKKYLDAFSVYESVFNERKEYSPAMLLRMAYIKDIREEYTEALYYLSLYHSQFPDRKVLEKISEIAQKNKLSGYELSDFEYVMLLYQRYIWAVTAFILAGFLAGLAYLFWRKRMGKDVLYGAILLNLGMALYFWAFNYGFHHQKGIVRNEKALIMNGPSAGGDVLEVIAKGNCLEVIGTEDIWYRVKWNDKEKAQEAYVRQSNLFLID